MGIAKGMLDLMERMCVCLKPTTQLFYPWLNGLDYNLSVTQCKVSSAHSIQLRLEEGKLGAFQVLPFVGLGFNKLICENMPLIMCSVSK